MLGLYYTYILCFLHLCFDILSAAERRCTPVLLSASVSDNSGNSPQMAALRRSREIDQSMQRFYAGCGYANHNILHWRSHLYFDAKSC